MDRHVDEVVQFLAAHHAWAGPIMFLVAFGESFVFLSLVFPGTAIMLVAGALVPSGAVPVVPLLVGSVAGAVLGDGVSYALGRRFGGLVPRVWPFSRHPGVLRGGLAFFEAHGGKSVFVGRFFGPVRAVVPLVAGMLAMDPRRFWLANVASAVAWAPLLLLPGYLATTALRAMNLHRHAELLFAALVVVVPTLAWAARRLRRARVARSTRPMTKPATPEMPRDERETR